MDSKKLTPQAVMNYLPQFFIGFFFIAAAYIKATEGLFGSHSSALSWIVQNWKTNGFMPHFYFGFADAVVIPHANVFAILVIILQSAVGVLLIGNKHVRLAGALLFFVQLNIYLATYNQLELRVLNSQAMLMGLFFFARPMMQGTVWKMFTYALVLVGLVHLYGRFTFFGDPGTAAYAWQRQHFALYVMSAWPGLKYFALWLTAGSTGPVLWAGTWWIKLLLLLGMLTRYRLEAGAAWLVLVTLLTLTWLNVFSCEGVFWVLTMYLWVTHEQYLQKTSSSRPVSLLP